MDTGNPITSRQAAWERFGERVSRGAALLDEACPGWAASLQDELRYRRLDMSSSCGCVLGQLFGSYVKGFKEAVAHKPSTELFGAAGHGFTLDWEEQWSARLWYALEIAWMVAIEQRTGTP